jgi:polysaccharide biosynthesis protein PslH
VQEGVNARSIRSLLNRIVSNVQILFLSTDFMWPANAGGNIRTLSQLQVLSSLAEVERIWLFSMHEDEIGISDREALARAVPKIEILETVFHPVHLRRHPRYVPRVAWLRAFRGVPYLAAKWDSPKVRRALGRALAHQRFDVVWLNGLGIAHYLPLVRQLQPNARVVLDGHDVENEKFAQFARRQSGPKKLLAEIEWRAARRHERETLRAVDAVGAITPDDARAYRELAGVEAVFVPQVATFARRTASAATGPRFCWVGRLVWAPNALGLDWFCGEVWPRIRRLLPEARFDIAGSGLPTDRNGETIPPLTWRAPGITTLGYVSDPLPLYERSAAMVVPTIGGTGLRIKLVEAFRHGIPVVTTPDGAAGLPIEPGREAFIESEPDAFAARAVELATSGSLRDRLRDASYAFLERHHSLVAAQPGVRALLGVENVGTERTQANMRRFDRYVQDAASF